MNTLPVVLCVFGTRPEAIKMAPVVLALKARTDRVRTLVCVTAQHREMLDQVTDVFGIVPDYDLGIMTPGQDLGPLTGALFTKMDPIIRDSGARWVLAQGDTTSTMTAALAAFYRKVRFGHVEAGLRTHDLQQPFPEEMNRRVADLIADTLFAPTEQARGNLLAEGLEESCIHMTGNTVVDALNDIANRSYDWSTGPLSCIPASRRLVLITAHRRESFGAPIRSLCEAIRELAERFESQGVQFIYPAHLNPEVQQPVREILGERRGVSILPPIDYIALVQLMRRSELILTDSGGIQEEAPTFHVPILVLREKTERPEGIAAGVAKLVGTDRHRIVSEASRLLEDAGARKAMTSSRNPYGDGKAATRIASIVVNALDRE
jgi:UDP-N-acetylglucosamine 2-epimerase